MYHFKLCLTFIEQSWILLRLSFGFVGHFFIKIPSPGFFYMIDVHR